MSRLYFALALCLAALPAYAQTQGTTSSQRAGAATKDFIKNAAIGDIFEIEASRLALDKTNAGEFKTFAQKIVDDHTRSSRELKSLAQRLQGVEVPAQLDSKHSDMINKLRSASGADFDRLYRSQQIEAHNQAIQLYQRYGQNPENPELGQFAQQTLPALREHLEMAQSLPLEPGAVGQATGGQQGQQQAQQPRQGQGGSAMGQRQMSQQPSGQPQTGERTGQQHAMDALGPNQILGSDLRGSTVYTAAGENVGEVDEIVLDRSGRAVALVVGVGGFLGIGEKNVAIPFNSFEITAAPGRDQGTANRNQGTSNRNQGTSASRGTEGTGAGLSDQHRIVLQGMTRNDLEAAPHFRTSGTSR